MGELRGVFIVQNEVQGGLSGGSSSFARNPAQEGWQNLTICRYFSIGGYKRLANPVGSPRGIRPLDGRQGPKRAYNAWVSRKGGLSQILLSGTAPRRLVARKMPQYVPAMKDFPSPKANPGSGLPTFPLRSWSGVVLGSSPATYPYPIKGNKQQKRRGQITEKRNKLQRG